MKLFLFFVSELIVPQAQLSVTKGATLSHKQHLKNRQSLNYMIRTTRPLLSIVFCFNFLQYATYFDDGRPVRVIEKNMARDRARRIVSFIGVVVTNYLNGSKTQDAFILLKACFSLLSERLTV